MKLQIITNLFPLPWEPNRAAFNKQQFEALSRKCEVQILVLVAWLQPLKYHLMLRRSVKNGIYIEYLRYFYIPGIFRFSYSLTLFFCLLTKIPSLLRHRPDCLLLSWAYPDAVAGIAIARLLRIPAVIKVHGSDINMHAQYRFRAWQIKWAIKYAEFVIAVSNALSEKLIEMGVPSEKVKVIYNGLNHQIFKPVDKLIARDKLGIPHDRKMILFIGNLKHTKGCVDLLEAWMLMAKENSRDTDLYFVGAGPAENRMRELITRENVSSGVKMLGAMNHESIVHWINASDLVALPSHNEGVPNVLLEAMACWCHRSWLLELVVYPEIVNPESGILVDLGDRQKLQEALLEGLQRSWNRERIAETMTNFDWECNAQQAHELFELAVSNR